MMTPKRFGKEGGKGANDVSSTGPQKGEKKKKKGGGTKEI